MKSRRLQMALAYAASLCMCACGGGDSGAGPGEDAAALEQASGASGAREVFRTRTKDNLAYATFVQYSSDGCAAAAIEVFLMEGRIKQTGSRQTSTSEVRAQQSALNYCTGESSFVSGFATTDDIRIRPDLSRASVKVSVLMSDFQGTEKILDVDMTLTGGEVTVDRSEFVFEGPNTRTIIRSLSRYTWATGMTGTVRLDGVDVTNFAQGLISSSKGATVEITRTR